METLRNACQCACGTIEFELRVNRHEQAGLLTCTAGHHSLLLDSRDYWADVLADGRPRMSRCGCGARLFRVTLEYDFRGDGDVRAVNVISACAQCGRKRLAAEVEIKYSPTSQLISNPLDPIEKPWLQPRRHEITSYWKPGDAQRFAEQLVGPLQASVFCEFSPYEFGEANLKSVVFLPELKHDLLFTNLTGIAPGQGRDQQNAGPFLRLTSPYHIVYGVGGLADQDASTYLLHYAEYSEDVVRDGKLERQPLEFLQFARRAFEWLKGNYVSLRGARTADNLDEYKRAEPYLGRRKRQGDNRS
jgi:hypothetical protein